MARWGQPRNLAICVDSSVFDVPGGPKKMADRGVFLSKVLPFALPSPSPPTEQTTPVQRNFLSDRCLPCTLTVVSRKSFAKLASSPRCPDGIGKGDSA